MKYYTPSFFHIKAPELTLVNDLEQGNADSAAAAAASSEFCVFSDGPYWVLGPVFVCVCGFSKMWRFRIKMVIDL